MQFPVVLHTDDGAHFGVTVPDLPGCFSGGHGVEEALQSALEAIDLHLQGLIEAGAEMPMPHSISEHSANPDYAGGVWVRATVDLPGDAAWRAPSEIGDAARA